MGFCDYTGAKYVLNNTPYAVYPVLTATIASEGIALKLRRSGSSRKYLYVQIFAGLAYVVASGFMLQLRRVKRKPMQNHSV